MSKALSTVVAAFAAFVLTGCLGGGMVVDASEPPGTDIETDTDGTEATAFSNNAVAGPLDAAELRERIAAAKAVPVNEIVFER